MFSIGPVLEVYLQDSLQITLSKSVEGTTVNVTLT